MIKQLFRLFKDKRGEIFGLDCTRVINPKNTLKKAMKLSDLKDDLAKLVTIRGVEINTSEPSTGDFLHADVYVDATRKPGFSRSIDGIESIKVMFKSIKGKDEGEMWVGIYEIPDKKKYALIYDILGIPKEN